MEFLFFNINMYYMQCKEVFVIIKIVLLPVTLLVSKSWIQLHQGSPLLCIFLTWSERLEGQGNFSDLTVYLFKFE